MGEKCSLVDFLTSHLPSASKREIKRALDQGYCRINGLYETFASKKLLPKDRVELTSHWKLWLSEVSSKTIKILSDDEDFIAIDKPSGLNSEGDDLLHLFPYPVYPIHRLDKATSGILLLAKKKKDLALFMNLFSQRIVEKKYLAIIDGCFEKKEGEFKSYLSLKKRIFGQKIIESKKNEGKVALTKWKQLASNGQISLIECIPLTGRTHQLRVQFFESGHPILGDFLYSKKFSSKLFVPRLLLHSYYLKFLHPKNKKKLEIFSTIPPFFLTLFPSITQKLPC